MDGDKGMNAQNTKTREPVLITTIAALTALGGFGSLILGFLAQNLSPTVYSGLQYLNIVFGMVYIICGIGLLVRKKWALYVLVSTFAVGILHNFYTLLANNGTPLTPGTYIVGVVIDVVVASYLWKNRNYLV